MSRPIAFALSGFAIGCAFGFASHGFFAATTFAFVVATMAFVGAEE